MSNILLNLMYKNDKYISQLLIWKRLTHVLLNVVYYNNVDWKACGLAHYASVNHMSHRLPFYLSTNEIININSMLPRSALLLRNNKNLYSLKVKKKCFGKV